jgi:hypothetical protein
MTGYAAVEFGRSLIPQALVTIIKPVVMRVLYEYTKGATFDEKIFCTKIKIGSKSQSSLFYALKPIHIPLQG